MAENQSYDQDNLEEFENPATTHKLPVGWLIMFIGLIVFGIFYFFAYTPQISGWTQTQTYESSLEENWYSPR